MVGKDCKKGGPMSVLERQVKEPYQISTALEPEGRSTFFFKFVVTYMTEISSTVN